MNSNKYLAMGLLCFALVLPVGAQELGQSMDGGVGVRIPGTVQPGEQGSPEFGAPTIDLDNIRVVLDPAWSDQKRAEAEAARAASQDAYARAAQLGVDLGVLDLMIDEKIREIDALCAQLRAKHREHGIEVAKAKQAVGAAAEARQRAQDRLDKANQKEAYLKDLIARLDATPGVGFQDTSTGRILSVADLQAAERLAKSDRILAEANFGEAERQVQRVSEALQRANVLEAEQAQLAACLQDANTTVDGMFAKRAELVAKIRASNSEGFGQNIEAIGKDISTVYRSAVEHVNRAVGSFRFRWARFWNT